VTTSQSLHHKAKWRASGIRYGRHITAEDRSETAALRRWREAASYDGHFDTDRMEPGHE